MEQSETKSAKGCLGCLVPLVLVFVCYIGTIQWGFYVQRGRNAAIAADVALFARSLAAYAAAHQGRYPAAVAELTPYLPDHKLPPNPWYPDEETLPVLALADVLTDSGLDHKAWPGAAGLVAGAKLPAIGVHLNAGPRGALIYDVSPDHRAYVVYGLGERSSSDSPFPLKTPKLVAARSAGVMRP